MGQNITNVARTGGRDGGPAWVRNWRNFQLDAQYRGEGIFRGVLASTNLCNYFGSDLKNLFGANQRIDLTKIRTRIKIPIILSHFECLLNDVVLGNLLSFFMGI